MHQVEISQEALEWIVDVFFVVFTLPETNIAMENPPS